MSHCTFALVPQPEDQFKYIEAAQQMCARFYPKYMLRGGDSLPHITVVQWKSNTQEAEEVYEAIAKKVAEIELEPFVPPFAGVSFINGEGVFAGTTWVELAIKRGDEDSPLMQIHNAAMEVLKDLGEEPLNATGCNYRPHLTLGRIKMPENVIPVCPKEVFRDTKPFDLDWWQYMEPPQAFSISEELALYARALLR